MNLPAIRSLRLAHPKAWITLMAGPAAAPLFQGHPDLDEVLVVDEKRLQAIPERLALLRTLRAARFDLAVVANPSKLLHFMVWAAGIPVRAGIARKAAVFLNRRMAPDSLLNLHEIDRNLRLAACAGGAAWDGMIALPEDEHATATVRQKLVSVLEKHDRIVALHPGTSHLQKRWPAGCFGDLARRMGKETGIVIVGGAEEKNSAVQIRRSAPGAFDWTGETSLRELAAFFMHPRVRALVSSDSGPVHVAWIAGTPAVALYASDLAGSDPQRWGPRDGVSRTLWKPMREIGVDEVYEALTAVLARSQAPAP